MKQKQLEIQLQQVKPFVDPKVALEQYHTPAHIAGCVVHSIYNEGDIDGLTIADLGAGTGMLSIGCCLMGAEHVYSVEIDNDAIAVMKENMELFEIENGEQMEIVNVDVSKFDKTCDVVLMNPPFGTRNKGIDMEFLKCAAKIAKKTVYSMHKMSTRKHVQKSCATFGLKGYPIAQLRYNLEATQKFHKQKSVDIEVDLWRFEKIK